LGKQTLNQLSEKHRISSKKIRNEFDNCHPNTGAIKELEKPLNIVFDATFFGRSYGILVFRGNRKNLYWKKITTESKISVSEALDALDVVCTGGYLSFTIDGKPGIRQLLEFRYPKKPIQYCQFHQKATIRRYTTFNPQTECGKALKLLMRFFPKCYECEFVTRFKVMKVIFTEFLKERNEKNGFKHKRLRSAVNSLNRNMPWLFTYQKHPHLNIPNTTNSCDGSFTHWKEKVNLHHGLKKERRLKMIHFILSQNSDSIS
jgi:hypothetical protein